MSHYNKCKEDRIKSIRFMSYVVKIISASWLIA